MIALLLATLMVMLPPEDMQHLVVPHAIASAAEEFGVSHSDLSALAFCESTMRPAAIGDGGAAVGLFQFHERTWYANARHLGYRTDLRADPVAASRVAAWKISREGYWAWEACGR